MEIINEILQSEAFFGLLMLIITSVFTLAGVWLSQLKESKKKEISAHIEALEQEKGKAYVDTLNSVAEVAVRFVQQTYQELDGPAKLQKAIEEAKSDLGAKLSIEDEKMERYVESAYSSMKDGWEKGKQEVKIEAQSVENISAMTDAEGK